VWAALIHQYSGVERQMEASAGPESLVQERRSAVVFPASGTDVARDAWTGLGSKRQQERPGSMTWAFMFGAGDENRTRALTLGITVQKW
jgi:hypothetical protein